MLTVELQWSKSCEMDVKCRNVLCDSLQDESLKKVTLLSEMQESVVLEKGVKLY